MPINHVLPGELEAALIEGRGAAVREAVARHGPDVLKRRTAQGRGVFGVALRGVSSEMVGLLLDLGADPRLDPMGTKEGEHTILEQVLTRSGIHWGSVADLARRLIDAGVDLNAVSGKDTTPLLSVLPFGSDEELEMLLAAGADLNLGTHSYGRPLHSLVPLEDHERIRRLLRAGADPEKRCSAGLTPLMWAAASDDRETCETLLRGGADPCTEDTEGRLAGDHARVFAWQSRGESLADYLCAAARAASGGCESTDALPGELPGDVLRAIRDGDIERFRARLRGAPELLNAYSPQGQSAPMVALRADRPESFWALLELGADLRMPGWVGTSEQGTSGSSAPLTLFQQAAVMLDRRVFEHLLACGADPDARGWAGENALHAAAGTGSVAMVASVLAAGADPNAESTEGMTPLGIACTNPERETTLALLKAGASPGVLNEEGTTPLVCWASAGDLGVCRALMEAGASLRAEDNNGQCPVEGAREAGMSEVAAYLESHRVWRRLGTDRPRGVSAGRERIDLAL